MFKKVNQGTTTFHAEVKTYKVPKPVKDIMLDGKPAYKLDNGNKISVENYNKYYGEPKKQKILPKNTKDHQNPLKSDINNMSLPVVVSRRQSKVL